MTARSRELDNDRMVQGRLFRSSWPGDGWQDRERVERDSKDCTDTVGQWETANPLYLEHNKCAVPVLNGIRYLSGSPYRAYDNCPINYNPLPSPGEAFFPWTSLDRGDQTLELLEGTNPNKPHVSVPTAIGELKDLPDLIRDWGGDLLKKVAKGYLSWRWAIKPMIRDIQQLCRFQEAVDKRIRELNRLADEGFVSKRMGLGSDTHEVIATSRTTLESTNGWLQGYRDLFYTSKVWGTCQWNVADASALPKTADGLAKLARRLTFGLTGYEALSTAWELMPWSWFIDWFVPVGDYISLFNNTVPVTWSKVCLMRTVTSKSQYRGIGTGVYSGWFTHSGQYWERQVVKRRYANTTPTTPFTKLASLPFLDSGKWSILGALAVLKLRR